MNAVASFLQKNYYTKYAGCPAHLIPDNETLVRALDIHKDKLVVLKDGASIIGVAVFLKLTDESFDKIDDTDVGNEEILSRLLQENGSHLHFILVAGNGFENIRAGVRMIKPMNPKSVSWWNPTNTRLHKYLVR